MDEARWRYVHLSSADILGCDGCVARSVCGGGCRASALQVGLGLYDRQPSHCLTTQTHMRAAIRIYETLMAENSAPLAQLLVSSLALNPALTELATR
jgi:hypothetical protein